MGVKEEILEVEDREVGDHFVSMIVRNRKSNFRWELVTVYGHVQHDRASAFISDLSRKCMSATLPIVLGVILISLGRPMKRTTLILI
jgi:hypothetical protein